MAVTAFWYGNGLKAAFNKEVDWDSDTVKLALATSSYRQERETEIALLTHPAVTARVRSLGVDLVTFGALA